MQSRYIAIGLITEKNSPSGVLWEREILETTGCVRLQLMTLQMNTLANTIFMHPMKIGGVRLSFWVVIQFIPLKER